jgi:hypothetical protein
MNRLLNDVSPEFGRKPPASQVNAVFLTQKTLEDDHQSL